MSRERGRVLGRYVLSQEIGAGGMATVHLGRLLGSAGFSRTVAIKRLHARLARDPQFVTMFLDEAKLASRLRHPNVVPIIDVGTEDGELFLVMDYVHGETLAKLIPAARASGGVPVPIAVAVLTGVLRGLHAAHEAKSETGAPLALVHRDVSPQNVLVGSDGLARVLDFGVAKAIGRMHTTRDGSLKGKFSYMAREQLAGERVDRRADVYAASVVLWETLSGKRLFPDGSRLPTMLGEDRIELPSRLRPDVPPALDGIVMRGLAPEGERFPTAEAMAVALEDAVHPATQGKVAAWMAAVAGASLADKSELVAAVEKGGDEVPSRPLPTAPAPPPVAPPIVTSSTSAGDTVVLPVHRVGRGLLAGVALVAILGVSVAWWLASSSGASTSVAAAPSASASPPTAASAAPTTASASAPASAPVDPTSAPTSSAAARPPAPRPKAPPPRPPPACSPPYTLDERGIRHPKPECF